MQELFVDGKNVLEPIDLSENKKKIMDARRNISAPITLPTFKEKTLFFPSKVTGENANKLAREVQDCLSTIKQRELDIYENVNTIYKIVESIHKGNIEGIVVAIQSAQKGIENAEYAIKQTKETLEILKDFKERLERSTEHLEEIDTIWDRAVEISDTISDLKAEIKKSVKENATLKKKISTMKREESEQHEKYESRLGVLEEHKRAIESIKHMNDVDELWEQNHNVQDVVSRIERMEHLEDIDNSWKQLNDNASALAELVTKLNQISDNQEKELTAIRKRIKMLFYIVGGSVIMLVSVIICNLSGILL